MIVADFRETTHLQIQASDYNNIPYNTDDSMESIIAKFIRLNRIPEACKYYMDETGLNDTDAIEFVVDTYKKIDQIDKDAFERLLNKLRVLKNKGFIEQAINEYQKFTLSEKNAAETFINDFTTVQRNYPIGSVDLNRNHSSDVLV